MQTRKLINCFGGLNTGSITTVNSIGNIFTTGGNIGIGTRSPSSLLDNNGTMKSVSLRTVNLSITNSSFQNITSANILSTNFFFTNISISSLIITNVTSTNTTSTNSLITNFSCQNVSVGTASLINNTFTNLRVTNSSITNLFTASTISTTNMTSTNTTISNSVSAGNFMGNGAVKTGTILMWPTLTAPQGYLLCDGSSYSNTGLYKSLHDVIGPSYGSSSGFFNVPNLRGRIPVGLGTSTSTSSLAQTGGSESHQLTQGQLPIHSHTIEIDSWLHSHTYNKGRVDVSNQAVNIFDAGAFFRDIGVQPANTSFASNDHIHSHSIASQGGNGTHGNMQPYIVINYIIKT